LKATVFKKLDVEKFFFEVERKFAREKRGSAIDVDLFANANLSGETQMDQLEELLHQFRRTPQTWLTMESTPHAVVRACLAEGRTDNLMRMLDEPLNFGLFPDDYSLVFMLNHFLLAEKWRDAAKVGVYMMLQEEADVPIAKEMALLGLYKHAVLGLADGEEWDPQAIAPEPEPEDEIKVHVEYLPNDYQDGHFDLVSREQRMGKALAYLARTEKDEEKKVNDSLVLLGRAILADLKGLNEALDVSDIFAAVCLEKAKEAVNEAGGDLEGKEDILQKVESKKSGEVDIEAELRARIEASVAKHEAEYVSSQTSTYADWVEQRERELERQLTLYRDEARRVEVLRRQREMKEEEERLFFFERQYEYERRKEERERQWKKKLPPRTWTRKISLKKKETVKDDYVPPDLSGRKLA